MGIWAGLSRLLERIRSEVSVPPPPFKASKRLARVMYPLWYGRMTPDEARVKMRSWGWQEDRIEEVIQRATAPPSYWSEHRDEETS